MGPLESLVSQVEPSIQWAIPDNVDTPLWRNNFAFGLSIHN